ncbi:unnamed protein product [Pleuronectes platessa]|uniref:Uncharacterized protein n=1 Tax=Pleuronectes platessa TaxID=8262 RepID=A0A9N7YFL0_PLEPL|nr:unnamed protein product [Pleuronectes platessa]
MPDLQPEYGSARALLQQEGACSWPRSLPGSQTIILDPAGVGRIIALATAFAPSVMEKAVCCSSSRMQTVTANLYEGVETVLGEDSACDVGHVPGLSANQG